MLVSTEALHPTLCSNISISDDDTLRRQQAGPDNMYSMEVRNSFFLLTTYLALMGRESVHRSSSSE